MRRRKIAIGVVLLLTVVGGVFVVRPKEPLDQFGSHAVSQRLLYTRETNGGMQREDHFRERIVEVVDLSRQEVLDVLHREYRSEDGWDWANPYAAVASNRDFSGTVGFWEKQERDGPHIFISENRILNYQQYWTVRAKFLGTNPFRVSPTVR